MADNAVQLRFRSTLGDIGPLVFNDSVLIQAVKEKLLAEWPTEGHLSKEPPTSANDIKLILSGKYVDATKPLKDYRKDMGEVKADTIVTMHIIVRPTTAAPGKQGQGSSSPAKQETSKPACCTIS